MKKTRSCRSYDRKPLTGTSTTPSSSASRAMRRNASAADRRSVTRPAASTRARACRGASSARQWPKSASGGDGAGAETSAARSGMAKGAGGAERAVRRRHTRAEGDADASGLRVAPEDANAESGAASGDCAWRRNAPGRSRARYAAPNATPAMNVTPRRAGRGGGGGGGGGDASGRRRSGARRGRGEYTSNAAVVAGSDGDDGGGWAPRPEPRSPSPSSRTRACASSGWGSCAMAEASSGGSARAPRAPHSARGAGTGGRGRRRGVADETFERGFDQLSFERGEDGRAGRA